MKAFFKKYWLLLLIVIVAIGFFIYFLIKFAGCRENPPGEMEAGTAYYQDSTVSERLAGYMADTVVRWYETPFNQERKPHTVYIDRLDSVTRSRAMKSDLMLGIEKDGNRIRVFAINPADSTIKESFFENVTRDFKATSTPKGIYIEDQNFYFDNIRIETGTRNKTDSLKTFNPYIKIQSGFNYREKIGITFGAEYLLKSKETVVNAGLYYYPFR